MTDKYAIAKYTKLSKEKNKKIGKKNIYDIINNTPELNLKQKVDYIRHHYAYYDGNYDYFYLPNGIPTSRLHKLNVLIYNIITKKVNPSKLTIFNEKVMLWRKNRNERLECAKKFKESIKDDLNNLPTWKKELANKTMIYEATLNRINAFLNSAENKLSKKEIDTISYQRLNSISKKWAKQKNVL